MTFVAREPPDPPALRPVLEPDEEAVGGGGTTSCVPKSLPIRLLINEPLPLGVGGGGTTVLDCPATLPLASLRKSREVSVEGGGAMTEVVGNASLGLRAASRSGADTGGGTTATLLICTCERATSGLTAAGAGGITLPLRAGAERALLRDTSAGAGAITVEFRAGATSGCSRATLGAGGTTVEFNDGAVRALSRERLGAGGTTELRVKPPRDRSRATLAGAGATTFAGRLGRVREACSPSDGGGPGTGLNARRLATASMEAGSFKLGASTTFGVRELPRATRMVCVRWCASRPPARPLVPDCAPPKSSVRGSSSPE